MAATILLTPLVSCTPPSSRTSPPSSSVATRPSPAKSIGRRDPWAGLPTCARAAFTSLPTGVDLVEETTFRDAGVGVLGSRLTYSDDQGVRKLTIVSGGTGEVGEGMTLEDNADLTVRGHKVTLLTLGSRKIALWEENDPNPPCGRYTVSGEGLMTSEFQSALRSIEVMPRVGASP